MRRDILCPGLLDIQVHFRRTGQEHKETIETGSNLPLPGASPTVACMPNTKPVIDVVVAYLHKRARETGYVNV